MSSHYATSTNNNGYKWSSSYRSRGGGEVSSSKQRTSSGSTAGVTGYSESSTKRHSRSKSVDDVLRGTSSTSANRRSNVGVERSSSTKHSSLQASDDNVKGNYRRSNTCGGDHRMNSTDEDFLCTNARNSKRVLMEESGADDRTTKSKYKIVGRITRSPSPDQKYCKQQTFPLGSSCYHSHNCSGEELNVRVARGCSNERDGKFGKDVYACNSHDESLVDRYNVDFGRGGGNSRRYDGEQREDIGIGYSKTGTYHGSTGYRGNAGAYSSGYDTKGYKCGGNRGDNRRGGRGGGESTRLPTEPRFNDSRVEVIGGKGSYATGQNDRDGGRDGGKDGERDGGRDGGKDGERDGGRDAGRNHNRSPEFDDYRGVPGDRDFVPRGSSPSSREMNGRGDGGYRNARPYGSRDTNGVRGVGGDRRGRSPVRKLPSTVGLHHSSPHHIRPYKNGDPYGKRRSPKHRSSSGRPHMHNSQIKRSRSLNDIGDQSASPTRYPNVYGGASAGGAAGAFPVCKRFPNCSVCTIDIPRQFETNKEQHPTDEKSDTDDTLIIEKKDKEIQLKSESISQITQMLQKTRKELEIKTIESNRREKEVRQLKEELKRITVEKKSIELTSSEQQITLTKMDATELRLTQMNEKCENLMVDNRELVEKIQSIEISQKEFNILQRNVHELQLQIRDMEDIEVHRDELIEKLQHVKKQRDDFLTKGRLVEEERNEFVRSNKTLEQYLADWKKKTVEFKRTNLSLKERILSLEKDKKELETKIVDIQSERINMQATICKLEAEKDDVLQELREVVLERNSLEQRLADLEDMLGDHDELEEGFHSLRLKVAELMRQRDDYESMTKNYKKKVHVLKRTVSEKEDQILQLTHDIKTLKVAIDNYSPSEMPPLKSFGIEPTSARVPMRGTGDYSRFDPNEVEITSTSDSCYDLVAVRPSKYDVPSEDSLTDEKYAMSAPEKRPYYYQRGRGRKYVALFDYDPYKSGTSDYPERELRLKEGDYITVYGEMDPDGFLQAEIDGLRGLVPGIYVEEITDESSLDHGHRSHKLKHVSRDRVHDNDVYKISTTTTSRERSFSVLYDYDPYTMGTTDRPDLELSLRKGDIITIVGSMGPDGYYTAILPNGKRGLVPSNFVEEYHKHSSSHHRHQSHASHTHAHQSHASHAHAQSEDEHFHGTLEVNHAQGPPYAPRDLKITRVVTRNAVLLSWLLPMMDDDDGYSNGCKVIGYRLWVNGKRKQDISSISTNKALVDDVDLNGRVEFSIQTLGEGDLCSEKCHFAITGALSALSNTDHQKGGDGDTYVAFYDYDPVKSSPNPNPSLELQFCEGDLMKVFDKSRNDGYYHAEMNGKRGLVPSNFIEFVKSASGSSSKHTTITSNESADVSNSRRVQFRKSSK